MRISIFGLGYVGSVSAGCLADFGHHVIGVDPNQDKVAMINAGRAPVVEPGLDALIAEACRKKRVSAVAQPLKAVSESDISLICVGTPSQPNGNLDLTFLERVCREIGAALAWKSDFHVVAVRSTTMPGTMRETVIPILEEASGKTAGTDFGVCNNPEFMREGAAVQDFREPPKTVIGESDVRAGDRLAELYQGIDAPLIRTDIAVAEMVKYANNAFHALKVTFGNEIGAIAKRLGIDGQAVMEIFCRDHKLNISAHYLKPGFAFGGSCLGKDLRALTYRARQLDLDVPVLNAILASNTRQIETGVAMILGHGRPRVGVLGLSFKADTDDLRESPMVTVVERLIGRGLELKIYDRSVALARLTGANRDYILGTIPHISKLLVDTIDQAIADVDIVVVGHDDPAFREVPAKLGADQVLIDFVRVVQDPDAPARYDGICW